MWNHFQSTHMWFLHFNFTWLFMIAKGAIELLIKWFYVFSFWWRFSFRFSPSHIENSQIILFTNVKTRQTNVINCCRDVQNNRKISMKFIDTYIQILWRNLCRWLASNANVDATCTVAMRLLILFVEMSADLYKDFSVSSSCFDLAYSTS